MSLTDRHFISPFDMEAIANDLNLEMTWRTFRFEQGAGPKMAYDMRKRLMNALKDADMDNSRVQDLIAWLSAASEYEQPSLSNGAKALYHFRHG